MIRVVGGQQLGKRDEIAPDLHIFIFSRSLSASSTALAKEPESMNSGRELGFDSFLVSWDKDRTKQKTPAWGSAGPPSSWTFSSGSREFQ